MAIPTIQDLGFKSVSEYQAFHGLLPDGLKGPITQKSLSQPRCCSRPDIEHYTQENNQLRKWPFNELIVSINNNIAPFDQSQTNDILIQALQAWADVANLDFTLEITPHRRHITVTNGRIDGPSGTLAWSELPNASNHVLQKYDSNEQWVLSSNPPSNKIDLLAVMVHELGHALGLSHAPATQAATNIMAPFYNPSIREPLSGDIDRIQNLYGKPTIEPNPPQPPEPEPNEPPLATGKFKVNSIHFTKDGLLVDISELPDDFTE